MLFLLILAAVLLVDIGLFIADRYWLSAMLFVATIAGSYFVFPEVAAFVDTHSYWTIGLYYLGAGVITAAVKWVFFNVGVAMKLRELRAEFEDRYVAPVNEPDPEPIIRVAGDYALERIQPPPAKPRATEAQIAFEKRKRFVEYLLGGERYARLMKMNTQPRFEELKLTADDALIQLLTPRSKHYVERITGWLVQWPIVIVTTIFEDLFVKIGKHLARLLDLFLRKLSAILIGGAVKGL